MFLGIFALAWTQFINIYHDSSPQRARCSGPRPGRILKAWRSFG
jgi:hypothetical protein